MAVTGVSGPGPGEATTRRFTHSPQQGHGGYSLRHLGRAVSFLGAAWNEPDQFDWITNFLRERGMLVSARLILATVAATAGMVPLSMLLGQRRPTTGLLVAQLVGIALTMVMAGCWLRRWPTRRQSKAAVLLGLLCVVLWSQAQPVAALASQVCVAPAITGGYIAFLHRSRLLVLNFAIAMVIDGVTAVRLERETDFVNAVGSFWLVLFVNLSAPLAIWGASRAIWVFASRSTEDPLTGLLNRRAFTETVLVWLRDRSHRADQLVVLLVDLDNFKGINDAYGHAAGDRLLIAVADVLRRNVPNSAAVCRSGGEEFLVAYTVPTVDPVAPAVQLCAVIRALSPSITASIGAASTFVANAPQPSAADFINDLVEVADQAMYAAKRNGGNHGRYQPIAG